METKNKIAIIGGGASGVVAGIFAAKNNDVTIFSEKPLGKKLLVTGNGRCNLTNMGGFSTAYNIDVISYLSRFNNLDTIEFFNSLGLEVYHDSEGRVYPLSNSAQSVVDVLNTKIQKLGIKVEKQDVFDVKIGKKILINNNFEFDKVIVASGSEASVLDLFNVEYKKFSPSLVALVTKQNTKRLSGIRLSDVKVTLKVNGKEYVEYGEVLFKDKGLSGICIFNLSSYLARRGEYNGKIEIDMLPKQTINETTKMLTNRTCLGYKTFGEFMQGLFNTEVNKFVLWQSGIEENDNLTQDKILLLAKTIKGLTFDVVDNYGNNQVKSGGISLDDLTQNLEHKKMLGVYFVGEICDVDGLCGGYNLQWAFASGKIAGESVW